MKVKAYKRYYTDGIDGKEIQRVYDAALRLNITVKVQANKIVIKRHRRSEAFRLFFNEGTYIEIVERVMRYSSADFEYNRADNNVESVDAYIYVAESEYDVPKPYYIPNRLIRHYLIIPKFEQFITELTAYLFITNTGPDQEQEITVTGKQAEEWISLITEMTNLHIIYSKQSHT
ncbi:MAG: hypothetical protein QXQ68_05870 [Candidatus Nitrosocaldaceae archaeon]